MRYEDGYMDSVKILLFSNEEKLYDITERVIEKTSIKMVYVSTIGKE